MPEEEQKKILKDILLPMVRRLAQNPNLSGKITDRFLDFSTMKSTKILDILEKPDRLR